ncbi:MAG: DUF2461 domain-containing protein [Pseudomonadota bacterium]
MTNQNGLTPQTFEFLADLARSNDRSWFEANRDRYEQDVMAPAIAFVQSAAPIMEALTPPHAAVPKMNGTIRRLHRDTRFGADKTPFKSHLHFIFWTGAKPGTSPAIHLVAHADSVGFGAGMWAMQPAQLAAFRAALADGAKRQQFDGAVQACHAIGCQFAEPELKRLPRGLEIIPSHEPHQRRKAVVMRTIEERDPIDNFLGSRGIDRLAELAPSLALLNGFLHDL